MSVAYTPTVRKLDGAVSELLGALAPWYEREEPDELGQMGADHLATTVWPLATAAEKAAAAVGNAVSTKDGPATLRLWDVAIVAEHLLGAATKGQDIRAFQALYVVVDKAHAEASEEWHPAGVEGEVSTTVDTEEPIGLTVTLDAEAIRKLGDLSYLLLHDPKTSYLEMAGREIRQILDAAQVEEVAHV